MAKEVLKGKVTKKNKITTLEQAINVITGCEGICVDVKNNIQRWVIGRPYSKKIIEAGAFLDNSSFKTEWFYQAEFNAKKKDWKETAKAKG
jgi:hypothetical protein